MSRRLHFWTLYIDWTLIWAAFNDPSFLSMKKWWIDVWMWEDTDTHTHQTHPQMHTHKFHSFTSLCTQHLSWKMPMDWSRCKVSLSCVWSVCGVVQLGHCPLTHKHMHTISFWPSVPGPGPKTPLNGRADGWEAASMETEEEKKNRARKKRND